MMVRLYTTEQHTKDNRYNFKKQLLKILAKYGEAEHEALANEKGGQYEVMFNEGLIPHYDTTREKRSPINQVASTEKKS